MNPRQWLAVTTGQALRFFFERLKDVSDEAGPPVGELLYNASVLAHFATTSTASTTYFPGCPASLTTVLDVFVLDRSQHADPDLMEAAGSQCLLLTGFFGSQLRRRHNVDWYAALGAGFYDQAARLGRDRNRVRMMLVMSSRFEFWRQQQARLARELRELPMLVTEHVQSGNREIG
jgi:hypothetical protein